MSIKVRVLADSIAPCGKRLTTWEAAYPRPIHSEVLTHRDLTRSSASSRAIPTAKLIQRIVDDPWVPMYIGANQKGMQAGAELSPLDRELAVAHWLEARDNAVISARKLSDLGVHKQVVNRLLEPWMTIVVLISATETPNFYGLRCHKDAEPHFQHLATAMREAQEASTPRMLTAGEWHLPLIYGEDWLIAVSRFAHKDSQIEFLRKVSVGRCARVSYLTHDGKRDLDEDVALHDRLVVAKPLHASPAEHVAQALDYPGWFVAGTQRGYYNLSEPENTTLSEYQQVYRDIQDLIKQGKTSDPSIELMVLAKMLRDMQSGNFMGFRQYRKMLPDEHIGGPRP